VWQSYQQLWRDYSLTVQRHSSLQMHNVMALVDFTCTVMEKYYIRRLRSFANSLEVAPRLLLQALLKKAEYKVCQESNDTECVARQQATL
jgi:hypothetical protein